MGSTETDWVGVEREYTYFNFAWSIGTFDDMVKDWLDIESETLYVFPGCCSFKLGIKRIFSNNSECYVIETRSFRNEDIDRHLFYCHHVWRRLCTCYVLPGGSSRRTSRTYCSIDGLSYKIQAKEIDGLLNEGSLEFRVQLRLTKLRQHREAMFRSLVPPDDLAVNFGNLLDSGELSDFTIKVGEKSLKVHKAILAARSPVFKSMFSVDMKEKKESSVELNQVDVNAMEKFLQYLYTNKTNFSDGGEKDIFLASDLLQLADQYQVLRLKTLCEHVLIENLSLDYVIDCLKLADTYGASNLRRESLKFVSLHRTSLSNQDMTSLISDSNGCGSSLGSDILKALSSE